MSIEKINLSEITKSGSLVYDYLNDNTALLDLVPSQSNMACLSDKISLRQQKPRDYSLLIERIIKQLAESPYISEHKESLVKLNNKNTFTITTAHQPSLFTGPAYVVIKALSTISLSRKLKSQHPECTFIPVFVLGSEDHDFEEINHLNVFGKRITWDGKEAGPVGQMSLEGTQEALRQVLDIFGTKNPDLNELLQRSFEGSGTYGHACQRLLDGLLGKYGLIVMNLNEQGFKQHFKHIIEEELFKNTSLGLVQKQVEALEALGYSKQAHPRPINFFFMKKGLRERIIFEQGVFKVNNTSLQFSPEEMKALIHNAPERFSPNVILRPLYQELILPNIAYVGGAGELSYWMQLVPVFEHYKIPYPALLRRDSLLYLNKGQVKKLNKIGLKTAGLFATEQTMITTYLADKDELEKANLSKQQKQISDIFDQIASQVISIDPTLKSSALAELKNTEKGIQKIEGKLIKALKQQNEVALNQLKKIKAQLFPAGKWQEREDNFLSFYLQEKEAFITELIESFDPIRGELTVYSNVD